MIARCLALAATVALTGCGGTFAKDAAWVDTKIAIPLTKGVCEVETTTQPPAGWVDVVCSFAEGIEAYIADAPTSTGTTTAATVKAPATVRMRLTVPRAKQIAASHPEVLSLPKGL